jgi:hypothetical protein
MGADGFSVGIGGSVPERDQMPKTCVEVTCDKQYRPTRRGCGGNQYVDENWLTVPQVMQSLKTQCPKDKKKRWLCKRHWNELSELAGTGGIDMNVSVQVRNVHAYVAMHCNLNCFMQIVEGERQTKLSAEEQFVLNTAEVCHVRYLMVQRIYR